jgi:hypothetical protein
MNIVGFASLGLDWAASTSFYVLPVVALESACRAVYRKDEKPIKEIVLSTLATGCLLIRVKPLSAGGLLVLTVYAYFKGEKEPFISLRILRNTACGLKQVAVSVVYNSLNAVIESIKNIMKAIFKHMIWGSVKVIAKNIFWGNVQIIWKEAVLPGLQSKYKLVVGAALAISALVFAISALPMMFSAALYTVSAVFKLGQSALNQAITYIPKLKKILI